MTLHTLLDDAWSLAEAKHAGQMYGDVPYIVHIRDVWARIYRAYPDDTEMQLAALLHDIVEDTDVTIEDIWARFGDHVAHFVNAVTSGEGSRKERAKRIVSKLEKAPSAIPIKLADRISNVEACWKNRDSRLFMYKREYKKFRSALRPLSQGDSVALEMWNDLDQLLGWWEPKP